MCSSSLIGKGVLRDDRTKGLDGYLADTVYTLVIPHRLAAKTPRLL